MTLGSANCKRSGTEESAFVLVDPQPATLRCPHLAANPTFVQEPTQFSVSSALFSLRKLTV